MSNFQPDRHGVTRYFMRRRIQASVIVRREAARLASRRDLRSVDALRVLAAAVAPYGISRRTLQRHHRAQIVGLRQICRLRYQRLPARRWTKAIRLLIARGGLLHDPSHRIRPV
jgi:hypothetical protein